MNTLSGKTKARQIELKKKYGEERVFAVPFQFTSIIDDLFTPWNYSKTKKDVFGGILPYGKFILRADAEEDISFQQIIPYAFITDNHGNYYISRRKQGEKRLQGMLSLGFGGHINPKDDMRHGVENMVFNGLKRELEEETTIKRIKDYVIKPYGLVRDLKSSTPDHIGIVFEITISDGAKNKLNIREKNKLKGTWMSIKDIIREYECFESWAQLIIAHLTLGKKHSSL